MTSKSLFVMECRVCFGWFWAEKTHDRLNRAIKSPGRVIDKMTINRMYRGTGTVPTVLGNRAQQLPDMERHEKKSKKEKENWAQGRHHRK